MRQVNALGAKEGAAAAVTVTLTYDQRCKSRQRLRLDDGSEAALLLPRGTVLAEGDRLQADDGAVIAVRAAAETLSVARTADPLLLLRAAYHLGNRHVPLQVAAGQLRYLHDHVLDALVEELGLMVEVVTGPFTPEGGAYSHGTAHQPDPGRGHTHAHDSGHHHEHETAHLHRAPAPGRPRRP